MTVPYFFKDVTLLITHYNRSTSLERLLKAFSDLNCSFGDIVVSDDGSNSEHLNYVKSLVGQYNFRLITTPENKGLGNNINKGQDAVTTPLTLYVQEDFVPFEAFPEHFSDAVGIMNEENEFDIVRFYSYVRYPHLKPYKKGYSEMIMRRLSLRYLKIYYYSDHPHLRRSSFLEKFGRYAEGIASDRTEYRMCVSFIQKKGKGLYYDNFKSLFKQTNPDSEPSTNRRSIWTVSKDPVITFIRNIYRQIRYNFDIRFLNTPAASVPQPLSDFPEDPYPATVSKILNKITGLYVHLRYRHVLQELRYFYKDTYYCRLVQFKYIIADYFTKIKYKVISFNGEFAPELQFVLPFAYWHYKNGTLKTTQASKYTKELYFFSPQHEEIYNVRTNDGNYNFDMPRVLYSHNYDMKKWLQVPLKETYRNDIYLYEKPILIIANRYNMEWGGPPLSYLNIPVLTFIIENLKKDFTIIYNRPKPTNIITDESEIYDLNEFEWLAKEHPEVILLEDLYKENKAKANNFNHLQLMVYANASHFISTHGGTSAFASYFGGINLIFSKQGPEHYFNCYHTLYPKLSGAKILHAKTDEQLKEYIKDHYIINPADKSNG
jgi:hypothetical protein